MEVFGPLFFGLQAWQASDLEGFAGKDLRVQFSGRTPAFQADDAGSIPATRSRCFCPESRVLDQEEAERAMGQGLDHWMSRS